MHTHVVVDLFKVIQLLWRCTFIRQRNEREKRKLERRAETWNQMIGTECFCTLNRKHHHYYNNMHMRCYNILYYIYYGEPVQKQVPQASSHERVTTTDYIILSSESCRIFLVSESCRFVCLKHKAQSFISLKNYCTCNCHKKGIYFKRRRKILSSYPTLFHLFFAWQ